MEEGIESLKEVLSRLFAARGWGRRQARLHLEKAWETAAGPHTAPHTRLSGIRRGVMEIEVDNAVLMQELALFQKRGLLVKLRDLLKGTTLNDLRFKAGNWQSR
jgi:predicted nucleic acid-binding Zn ribbon protein